MKLVGQMIPFFMPGTTLFYSMWWYRHCKNNVRLFLARLSFGLWCPTREWGLLQTTSLVRICGRIFFLCDWKSKNNNQMFDISVNLSIADTMVSSLNVPFNFVYMLNGNWPFGNIYCKICCYISMVSVCGSVFTLVAISGDR